MHELIQSINSFFGPDVRELTIAQVTLRAVITYVVTIAMVRWGHKRFMGRSTAFDVILGIILGSVISRGINGQAPFVQTVVAAAVLIIVHWLFAYFGFQSKTFGRLIKGGTHFLLKDGKPVKSELRSNRVTESEILESMRLTANLDRFEEVVSATLENSGEISIVKAKREPKVIEITVENGVKIVRIEVGG